MQNRKQRSKCYEELNLFALNEPIICVVFPIINRLIKYVKAQMTSVTIGCG